MKSVPPIRNVAIIAHVDHGKTTLVDAILRQLHVAEGEDASQDCLLDSNVLERERGITILAKNVSVRHRGIKINVIDTPGHADFGGQVERVLNMADGVLLLVDAAEGPMPQTRFVLDKALKLGLKPIVVLNKVDKPAERHDEVLNEIFDLFVELGASHDQLDFPILYAAGRDGWAVRNLSHDPRDSILPLLDAILEHIPAPKPVDGPVQMQITSIDYSDYTGRIGIGRVRRGVLDSARPLALVKRDRTVLPCKIRALYVFEGLGQKEAAQVACGDVCAVHGIEGVDIGDTLTPVDFPEPLEPIALDAPTIAMMFRINDSPGFGSSGKYLTSRHIRERLHRETQKDVALAFEEVGEGSFKVSGRGVLHLAVLVENMRREGYELTISRPRVIVKTINGVRHEPVETLVVDTPDATTGPVIENVGKRQGLMQRMHAAGGRTMLEFAIPTRGLIGLRTRLVTATSGEAIINHRFLRYEPMRDDIPQRPNGVLISMEAGKANTYALDGLQDRGFFFVDPGDWCYEGQIVGEHCKDNDLVVNVQRAKKLTNIRAAGADRKLFVAPATRLSLEEALEYINDDELVEATPGAVRLRKYFLKEIERKRNRDYDWTRAG
ncbi:MAG TPA: translational GTPase TypA [Kiritimatiellia bacterium]|jgi:GTP-binding protein|nr:translational GTPase TypA [Lentisphaerota bacterium]HPC19554.1 translational GTPase TypA [Kiritimatiellia bacterium]HQN80648.1 translational GTPase TypA [Kiritimatiellia bacterium]HQQ60815.1 translational GTPase TypA [Kiritimatiellia bacterium]